MKCVICGKGVREGVALFRINELGVEGLWACERDLHKTDAPPVDTEVKRLVDAIEGKP